MPTESSKSTIWIFLGKYKHIQNSYLGVVEQKTLQTKRNFCSKKQLEVLFYPLSMNSFQDLVSGSTCHHIVCDFWLTTNTLSTNITLAEKIKEYTLETHLTWKLGVLITPDAFLWLPSQNSVSGTHLADERTWFVASGAVGFAREKHSDV